METYIITISVLALRIQMHISISSFHRFFKKKQFKMNVQNKILNISIYLIFFFSVSLIGDMPFCLMSVF